MTNYRGFERRQFSTVIHTKRCLFVHTLRNQLLSKLSLNLFNTFCRYVTEILKIYMTKSDPEKI